MAKNETKSTGTPPQDEKDTTAGPAISTVKVPTPEPVDDDKIVVSKKDLEGFLKRLDDVEADNKRLIAVADKGRLANEREKSIAADGAPLIRTVKLTRLGRGPTFQIVVAWKLTDNESYVDGNRMVEKQNIQVVYKDGTSENIRLIDFYRRQNKETIAEIIKRSVNERTGETEVDVELKDGERITLPIKFVN